MECVGYLGVVAYVCQYGYKSRWEACLCRISFTHFLRVTNIGAAYFHIVPAFYTPFQEPILQTSLPNKPLAHPSTMSSEDVELYKPALKALVGSFQRWKGYKDKLAPYPERTSMESFESYAELHNLPPPPRSFVFIANLPTVAIADLPDEEQRCSICLDSYFKQEDEDNKLEMPTRLPCGHVVGKNCLRKWVFPYGTGERCPICRADCLLEDLGLDMAALTYNNLDGFEITVDEEVWADHDGGSPLSASNRARVRNSRYRIVEERLQDAWEELYRDYEMLALPQVFERADGGNNDTVENWQQRKAVIDEIAKEIAAARRVFEVDVETERIEREREGRARNEIDGAE